MTERINLIDLSDAIAANERTTKALAFVARLIDHSEISDGPTLSNACVGAGELLEILVGEFKSNNETLSKMVDQAIKNEPH